MSVATRTGVEGLEVAFVNAQQPVENIEVFRVMIGKFVGDDIDGIVFDAVGTLIEPHPPVADVYLASAHRQGVELERDEIRARFQRQFRNDEQDDSLGPWKTDEALERRRWRRIVGGVLPELPDGDRAFEELWDHFSEASSWRCFPDVGPTVDWIVKSGRVVCIGSNFDARLRRVAAGLPDLAAFAGKLVISSEVGYRKPHPRFFQRACQEFGLEPQKVLCVGDDPEADVAGAKRAGLRAILIERDARKEIGVESIRTLSELSTVSHSAD